MDLLAENLPDTVNLSSRLIAFALLSLEEVYVEGGGTFNCPICDNSTDRGIMAIEYTSTKGLRVYIMCHKCFNELDDKIFDVVDRH